MALRSGLVLALSLAAAVTVGLAGGAAPARAEDDDKKAHVPSPEAGFALADRLCKSCHIVGAEAATAQVGPPPFKSIANKPGQSFDHIRSVLIQPHAPMPDLQLTNDEMVDLAAYLDTLKAPGSPPLLPPPGEKTDRPKQG